MPNVALRVFCTHVVLRQLCAEKHRTRRALAPARTSFTQNLNRSQADPPAQQVNNAHAAWHTEPNSLSEVLSERLACSHASYAPLVRRTQHPVSVVNMRGARCEHMGYGSALANESLL